MTIRIESSQEKHVFANADGSIVVVCHIGSILDGGTPIDPESGDDLTYLGIADESGGTTIPCNTYKDQPEIIFL